MPSRNFIFNCALYVRLRQLYMGFSRSFKTVSKSSKQVFKNCQKNLRRVLGWQVATSLSITCYTKPRHKSTIAKVIKNFKRWNGFSSGSDHIVPPSMWTVGRCWLVHLSIKSLLLIREFSILEIFKYLLWWLWKCFERLRETHIVLSQTNCYLC